jgi:NitT/TauT family transport system substrate-binding protein
MTSLSRRRWLAQTTLAAASIALPTLGRAQAPVKIKFQMDWRADGQSAPFYYTLAKGYFEKEGLDVSLDVGSGSAMAVNRLASGSYDMGYGDVNALIEFLGSGTAAVARPQAVYQTLDQTPAGVMVMTRSGITTPAGLAGKTLGAPVFDAGRKLWPLFAKLQGLAADSVKWQSMDPGLREVMLVRGDVDAVTGFQPSGLISAIAAGAREEDLRVFLYKDFGVNVYGNAILATSKFIAEQPQAVAGFLRAYNKGLKEVIANPDEGVRIVRQREPMIDAAIETRRLKGLIDVCIVSPTTKAQGLGELDMGRLDKQIDDVASVFNLRSKPAASTIFNPAFLPPKQDRMLG